MVFHAAAVVASVVVVGNVTQLLVALCMHDVIGHVTFKLAVGGFLRVVNDDHASIWHGDGDMAPQI